MRIASRLRAVRQLGPAVQRAGLIALPTLAMIGLALRTAGYARTCRWLARPTARSQRMAPSARQASRDTVVAGVLLAARVLPWRPACLERSMALRYLLRRRGYAARLRIGVRKRGETAEESSNSTAAIEAHAWVEVDGEVVGDRADVDQRFLPFEDSQAPLAAELARLSR